MEALYVDLVGLYTGSSTNFMALTMIDSAFSISNSWSYRQSILVTKNTVKREQSKKNPQDSNKDNKDEKRFCVDFRQLNKITKPIAYPLPLIDDILALLGKSKYFTSLDLISGYWQIPIKPEDREKTAFASGFRGLFHFNVMPFGASGAGSIFQELANKVLKGCEGFAVAYLDDILIFSPDLQSHLSHVDTVLQSLSKHNLKLKLSKCQFLQRETRYLGFIIDQNGIKPDPLKVEAIRQFPRPKCVRDVRSILGAAGFYRRFCPSYSELVEPLINLTRKNVPFTWSKLCEDSFKQLKDSFSQIPYLSYPDPNKPYILYTDASDKCIGACLTQKCESNETGDYVGEKPIFFLSHRLSPTQCKYSTIEKRMLQHIL